MIDDIASVVDDYNKNNKYADNLFVNKICTIYVNEKNLNKYLKDVYTSDVSLKNGRSNYNPLTKELVFDLDERINPIYRVLLGDKYVYFNNLHKLRLVLHELEHVSQEKQFNESDDSFEHKLVKLNNYVYMYPSILNKKDASVIETIKGTIKLLNYSRYYNQYHDSAPIERLANIKSYLNTKEIYNKLDVENFGRAADEYRYYSYLDLDRDMSYGYRMIGKKTNSPSLDFFKGIKEIRDAVDEDEFEELSNTLPFEDKVLYGLSLTKEESKSFDDINPYTYLRK
jgi:hypothetical protein